MNRIKQIIKTNLGMHQRILQDEALLAVIDEAAEQCTAVLQKGHKILICGNGGSAADAQHMAAELVGRFQKERKGLPAIALNTDTSILTAWANDYDYESVFERQIEALGQPGDILFGISTSGSSQNVLRAFELARKIGIRTVGLSGKDGGAIKDKSDLSIVVPENITARIQEAHIMIIHIICELLENELFE